MRFFLILSTLSMLCGVCLSADKPPEKFPRDKDDVYLLRIKSDPKIATDKEVNICGYVYVSDYFPNYTHPAHHYNLAFVEGAKNVGDKAGEVAFLYLSKPNREDSGLKPRPNFDKAAADAIAKIADREAENKLTIVRAKVVIMNQRWDVLNLVDLQFYDSAKKEWGPWIIRPTKEADAKEQQAKEKADEEERQAKVKAEADMKAAAIQKKEAEEQKAKAARQSNEKLASSRLKTAKAIFAKDKTSGKRKLQEIIDDHPNTESAKEAKKLVDSAE